MGYLQISKIPTKAIFLFPLSDRYLIVNLEKELNFFTFDLNLSPILRNLTLSPTLNKLFLQILKLDERAKSLSIGIKSQ